MSVDGQDGEPVSVTTGLPQGSPISPILFALYIAEIHGAVEDQVEDSQGISVVDITWIVEGTDINDVTSRLERCAAASLRLADDNAVRCEVSKTEAIPFSKRRKHRRCERDPSRNAPGPLQSRRRAMAGHLARLHAQLGGEPQAPNRKDTPGRGQASPHRQPVRGPLAARNLQATIVQGTMLYASEPTWNGKKEVEREYQLAINRMGRASLGAFISTPRGIVAAGGGFTPARALSDHR